MTNTPRNQWPYPDWNANWQEWQNVFRDMVLSQDSTVFSCMEGLKNVFQSLPDAQIIYSGGAYWLTMTADLVIISRTYNTQISIVNDNLELTPNMMVCARVTAGAVGTQETHFELVSFAEIDPDLRVFGYVDDEHGINWFNGSRFLPAEDVRQIFSFLGTGGGGTDDKRVKVSAADTTAQFLSEKLLEGTNITLTIEDVGGNEKLRVASTGGTGTATLEQYAVGYGDASNELYGDATYLYYNANRQVGIGVGTPNRISTTSDSLYVTGKVEVDGIGYFDTDIQIRGDAYLYDDKAIYLGNSQDAVFGYSATSQTTDTLLLGLPATSNNLIVTTKAGFATDWVKTIRTNPTVFIMSANASTSMYSAHYHNQSNALWESGYGSVAITESYIAGSEYGAAFMPWALNSAEWTAAKNIGGVGCSLLGLIAAINTVATTSFGYVARNGGTQWTDYALLYQGTGITLTDGVHGVNIANAGVLKITKNTDATGNIVFAGAGVSQVGNTFTFASTQSTLTEGAVGYGDSSNLLTGQTGNLFYNATSHFFGINNAAPTCGLRVGSSGTIGYTSPSANDMFIPGRIQATGSMYMYAFGDAYLFDPTCNWSETGMQISKSYSEWNLILTKFGGGTIELSLFEILSDLYDMAGSGGGGSLDAAYRFNFLSDSDTIYTDTVPMGIVSSTDISALAITQNNAANTSELVNIYNQSNNILGSRSFFLGGSVGSIDNFGHRFAWTNEAVSIGCGDTSVNSISYINAYAEDSVCDGWQAVARIYAENHAQTVISYVKVRTTQGSGFVNIVGHNGIAADVIQGDCSLTAASGWVQLYGSTGVSLSTGSSGYINCSGRPLRGIKSAGFGTTTYFVGTISGGTVSVDFDTNGNLQWCTATANITSFTLTHAQAGTYQFKISASGANVTVSGFPASITWHGDDPDATTVTIPNGQEGLLVLTNWTNSKVTGTFSVSGA